MNDKPPPRAEPDALLVARGVTRRFPGVLALDHVDLDLYPGEVHALVGENGAGKSTLVRIIAGVETRDSGALQLDGKPYEPASSADSIGHGIRVVHQELNLLPYLTVAENIFFERLPRRRGLVDYRTMYRESATLLDAVGLNISPRTKVETLGIAQMQLVEIARAVSARSRLLILDEPTATLTPPEKERLFAIIDRLRSSGVGIVFISHHLDEVVRLADRCTILRNGARIAEHCAPGITVPALVRQMVGRDLAEEYPPRPEHARTNAVLEVSQLRRSKGSSPVDLMVRQGEVLGVVGLVGAGRTEIMRGIFGADVPASGTVHVGGRPVTIRTPRQAVRAGIGFLTEDRKAQGLVLDLPCDVNTTLAAPHKVSRFGVIDRRAEREAFEELSRSLRIKVDSPRRTARTLSGGNQQKVVLAKWLFAESDVLIVDEPTRGVDVGAKYEIHRLLGALAERGKSVIIISSDLNEVTATANRIMVVSNGAIAGVVDGPEFDKEEILALAYSGYLDQEGSAGHGATESLNEEL
ncbi:sugar ABC transporter ATP-binding protein [Georgenia wangjunii]|uniref:sugar ABC transporter ATP-binding protein n=1 Tax=Georgenia wangjunii TaxID=3117730 RepID=UPI002F2690DE